MAQRAGAVSLIIIRRDEARNKRSFAITPEQADYLYKKKDGKSIKWSWFHTNAIELIRLKIVNILKKKKIGATASTVSKVFTKKK